MGYVSSFLTKQFPFQMFVVLWIYLTIIYDIGTVTIAHLYN